jgi:hypothetical protein
VLGWNLALSRPVILTIAWLAGRLLGVCHPGIEDRAALKPVEQLRHGGRSVIRSRRRSMSASWLMTTMASWASGVCSYWRMRRRQRYIQAKSWMIKPPLGLIPPTIWDREPQDPAHGLHDAAGVALVGPQMAEPQAAGSGLGRAAGAPPPDPARWPR